MTPNQTSLGCRRWKLWSATLATLVVAASGTGCSGLLDVENPNNVPAEELDNPTSATGLANGALSALARAWSYMVRNYATVTDELTWTGSRDGFRQFDFGFISNPSNEFTDAAFPFVGEARWLADLAIAKISEFDAAGTLKNRNDLVRSYLYGSLAYTMIADMFANFPIGSDRREAAPPLGQPNMVQVYDAAIAYATTGIALAQATKNKSLELALTAQRARARHAKAVWALFPHPPALNAPPPANPFINDADANTDATRALSLVTSADWKFRYTYSPSTVTNQIGVWVTSRQEMRFGDRYVNRAAKDTLDDPVTGTTEPELRRAVVEFVATSATQDYFPLTALSQRELYLMLAEAALAQGDTIGPTSGFATRINQVRALNSLETYDPSDPAHPRPVAMLKHARMVNLFMQGRRLHDLYRFGERADMWQLSPIAEAIEKPGTVFPIALIELTSNPFCVADPTSCY